VHFCVTININ